MRMLKLEMKRILKTKLTLILFATALVLTFITAYLPTTFYHAFPSDENGEITKVSGLAAIEYDKKIQADTSGDVTPEKVRTALENYQAVMNKYGVTENYDLPDGVYQREITPYAPLLHGLKEAYADSDTGHAAHLMDIAPEDIDHYYEACLTRVESLMKLEQGENSPAEKVAVDLYNQVEKPYQFYPGYSADAMDYQIMLTFLILCICAVIAAPIFTADYQTGADDILRCTKFGRVRFALVKICSALLICGITFGICAILYVVISNTLFGWESTKTSIQMMYSIASYPNMTIQQMQWFNVISGLLAILATASILLFLSSRCKNMVVSLSLALLFCILPMIIYIALPSGVREWVYSILPSSGAGLQTCTMYAMVDIIFLNIGKTAFWLPYVMIGACAVEIPLFAGMTVYSYSKNRN